MESGGEVVTAGQSCGYGFEMEKMREMGEMSGEGVCVVCVNRPKHKDQFVVFFFFF